MSHFFICSAAQFALIVSLLVPCLCILSLLQGRAVDSAQVLEGSAAAAAAAQITLRENLFSGGGT